MRIWVAYKFRGASFEALRQDLEALKHALAAYGHEMITMIETIQGWNASSMPKQEAVRAAYAQMQSCDIGLFLYPIDQPSEGRGWDAGYMTGLGKPTVMALGESISLPYTEALYLCNIPPSAVLRYTSMQDLATQMNAL